MANIVIATTTFSKTADLRSRLALRTVQEAKRYGYPIVVIDGGSYEEFRQKLVENEALLFRQLGTTMGASRRQAIAEAAKMSGSSEVVVWMEPEKHTFVPEIHRAAAPVLSGDADLVVPRRKSLESYPLEQQYAEHIGNLAFFYLTGQRLDPWFGPRLMNARAVSFFLGYAGEYGDKWDSIFIPVLRAMNSGLRIAGVEVNYTHPQEQTKEEIGNINMLIKRVEQLLNLVPSLEKELKT